MRLFAVRWRSGCVDIVADGKNDCLNECRACTRGRWTLGRFVYMCARAVAVEEIGKGFPKRGGRNVGSQVRWLVPSVASGW